MKKIIIAIAATLTAIALPNPNVSYGAHTYGKVIPQADWTNTRCIIGKFCSISTEVQVFLGGNHRTDWISTYPFVSWPDQYPAAKNITGHPQSNGDIIIENDVWIGHHAIIMSGVTIGNGAVIGAYSLVAKNVPPYAIYAGNPARLIRYRFDKGIIDRLLKLKWWDWPLEKIKQNAGTLCSVNINRFLDENRV